MRLLTISPTASTASRERGDTSRSTASAWTSPASSSKSFAYVRDELRLRGSARHAPMPPRCGARAAREGRPLRARLRRLRRAAPRDQAIGHAAESRDDDNRRRVAAALRSGNGRRSMRRAGLRPRRPPTCRRTSSQRVTATPRRCISSAFRIAAPAAPRIVLWPSADELAVEDRAAAKPANGHGHAAVAARIECRLRTVRLVRGTRSAAAAPTAIRDRCGSPRKVRHASMIAAASGFCSRATAIGTGVPVLHRHARRRRADHDRVRRDSATADGAEHLLRFGFDFLFFAAADMRDDVAENVPRGHAGISSARYRLHRRDQRFLKAELTERCERHRENDRRAVRIRDDAAGPFARVALPVQQVEMVGVHFGNQQRNGRFHPVVARVAHDGAAGSSRTPLRSRRRPRNPGRKTPASARDREPRHRRPCARPRRRSATEAATRRRPDMVCRRNVRWRRATPRETMDGPSTAR